MFNFFGYACSAFGSIIFLFGIINSQSLGAAAIACGIGFGLHGIGAICFGIRKIMHQMDSLQKTQSKIKRSISQLDSKLAAISDDSDLEFEKSENENSLSEQQIGELLD